MSPRSVTITSTGGRPLTVNALVNMHRMQWANKTKEIRREFQVLALQAARPHNPGFRWSLDAIDIEVTPLHRDNRSPQDVAACAPHAKAAIDGIVDAGIIPDDDPTHLRSVTFRQPCVCGEDGLRLVITEAS